MAVRRVHRTALHRDGNHARVKACTDHLLAIFDHWVSRVDEKGYSATGLITPMETAASVEFPRAFALGRHQAYPKLRPSPSPSLTDKLTLNRHYLQNSLAPAIDERVNRWKLDKETIPLSEALTKSFRARVAMYGGASWNVTEAGYRAGVAEARADLAKRLHGRILADEGDEEPQPGDHELAIALGLTVLGLMLLLSTGRDRAGVNVSPDSSPPNGLGQQDAAAAVLVDQTGVLDASGIRVGTAYEAEDDACDPCAADVGEYWDDDPPLPGEDCDGLNACRCWLTTITEESAAA